MSEEINISPLLDDFKLGAPICERNGVVCRPAIKENTNKKYIVKIISVPATQAQLDALLLAGAYKDPADAMEYYRKKGESILEEAELLRKLSKLEGFLPFDGWQMEPITRRRLGYEVYLVSSYKRSLDKFMRKHAFTHLEAINLALDLCAALSVSRQSGYMYVDLKPSNIYVSEKKEYRIGDIGFLDLNSLRFASLPERYYSPYIPPELTDPMAVMDLTVDTYAVGMILYQLYNDGHLPVAAHRPDQPLPMPAQADYEMAEIIMKAISLDPAQRWNDPKDLGKAIASYMQRNSINDIPITPFIPLDVQPEAITEAPPKKEKRKKKKKNAEIPPEAEIKAEEAPVEEPADDTQQITGTLDPPAEVAAEPADVSEVPESVPEEETSPEPETALPQTAESEPEATVSTEEEPAAPMEEPEQEEDFVLSEDILGIVSKADDLIAHEIPEELICETAVQEDPFSFVLDETDIPDDSIPEDPLMEEETDPERKVPARNFVDETRKKKFRKFISGLLTLILLAAAGICGFWFYQNVYLQEIEAIRMTGTQDQITVLIDTYADESRLSVTCTNEKGKKQTSAVQGGKAIFSGLEPNTQYTIEVEMTGFYKAVGHTTGVITTEATTQILTFDAIAGSEDGSVKLDFTVDGNEPNFWNIRYSAEGEDEKRETITNHSTMITGLTVGKVYTFTIDGGTDFALSGKTSMEYMAAKLILAEDLTAVSSSGNEITVQWRTPGDVVVENWNVRCYDGYGYEEQFTVTETKAMFTGLDPSSHYTVEITAAGMTQPAKLLISENPVNISDVKVDESKATKLIVSWEFTGEAPAEGWILSYTIDGSGSQTLECPKPTAEIMPLVPGATYSFTLQTADGKTVLNNRFSHTTAEAETFTDNAVILEDFTFDLLKTPVEPNWTYETLNNPVFSDTFGARDSVSIIMRSSSTFYLPGYETKVMYVFRNSYGNVLTDLISEETYFWKNIWNAGDAKIGELNIPKLPTSPGDYVLELYFNGKAVAQLNFSIAE